MKSKLSQIQKLFPDVTKLKDATEPVLITVTERDAKHGTKKDPGHCALAQACFREKIASGAIIGIAYSWLIKGETATRYKTSGTVAREITSFDRQGGFAPGINYRLATISPKNRLGIRNNKNHGRNGGKKPVGKVHRTDNIRVVQ